jgi:diaminohydroxyphosphoribosylaminopyrimidine deaminase/5-amino-6-(5-phosphoribosylamino)uracil reductase
MIRWTSDDERWMSQALALAARGQGYVEPNPMVGCVIVRSGRLLGAGYHRRYGGPHAEIEALRQCHRSPRGATVYVSLEPCCHFGKTPPCTEALIAAAVARVVAPLKDANELVAGKGFAALRKAGIQVDVGLLAERAAELNTPFFKLIRQHRPWVILKWAQSLDGKIATRTGESKWITDEACRTHAHRTRGRVDAVLVGIGTVLRDDPLLTCRLARPRRIAARVVLDSELRTPLRSRLVQTARQVPTWIFHGREAPSRRMRALERGGCQLQVVPSTARGLSLPAVLDALGRRPMTNVLVEGGGRVLGSFFD